MTAETSPPDGAPDTPEASPGGLSQPAPDTPEATLPGLAEAEAAERLRTEGYNELPSARRRNILAIAYGVAREPMFLLLIAAGGIYAWLGELRDASMLLGFVFVIMGITFYQERKTERALEALRDLSSPRALVIRDGQQRRIPGREVVRGDIAALTVGDRVPADARLVSCTNLSIDESLLTGESVPVRKQAWDGIMGKTPPGGDDLPFVYSGTLVVNGQGLAEVQATGPRTELGRIGKALEDVSSERTPLQKETGRLVRVFAVGGVSLALVIVVVYSLTRGDWTQGFLAGITLAMAMLPEEFPVVLTVFLALGAWRISKERVLTRRVPAVETLGSATVLCVDKTGTLTQNRMTATQLFAQGAGTGSHAMDGHGEFFDVNYDRHLPLPESFHEILEFAILASHRDPFDPIDKALKELGDHYLVETEHLHKDWRLMREYPLSRELLALSRVWASPSGEEYVIAAKGAPESISDLCHMSDEETKEVAEHVAVMTGAGLRVLGVAKSHFRPVRLPGEQHEFKFTFLGLVGLADPVRSSVFTAVRECYDAGVRVIMITGDYLGTAQNIARQIDLESSDVVITGPELDEMDDEELQRRIRTVNVFARMVPEQKLRLVRALEANAEIVAMTGDGVNDAPALKSAGIGIAMGARGTDVAREAAALVLLDDDFSSIVKAIRLGRRIFDNIKKAMTYIFAVHVPIAGMSVIPVLFKWPLVLLPVHIVFLELIIDPACSVVFEAEPEEAGVMKRPPRDPKEPLFGRRTLAIALLQGLIVLGIVLSVYAGARYLAHGEAQARALTFTALVTANLALILTNRSWSRTVVATLRSPNTALWWVFGGTLAVLAAVLYVPFLRAMFHFSALPASDLVIAAIAGVVSILWFEGLKLLRIRM